MNVKKVVICTVLLKVLLAGSHQLDGSELVAISMSVDGRRRLLDANLPTVLESRDDRANESTLYTSLVFSSFPTFITVVAYLDAIRLDSNEAANKFSSPPDCPSSS